MEEEQAKVWKEIEGFSRYMVSPDGEVLDTKTNKLVAKQLAGKPQYYYVNVNRDDGQRKLKRVHRFVAEAYVEGRSDECNVVDHIDRDKFNNHYTNLRWVDHSGNQRNREGNIYIFGEAVKDYSQMYENPEAAYSYLATCLNQGMSDREAVDKYQENLDYGLNRVLVEWDGEDVYLVDLCESYNKDYFEVNGRLRKGWDIWNAIYNIYPEQPYSLQVPCEVVTGHWFPSKKYFGEYFDNRSENILELADSGATYQQLKSYDKLDHLRQTVLGVTGTIKELCKHFGISEGCVGTRVTRKGWPLEKALTTPQERIRRWSIDGETKSIKEWCEHYKLDPKVVNGWKSRLSDRTFKDALLHYGVDCKDKEFLPGD